MASLFTPNKDIEKPGQGEQSGVWGLTVNRNFDKIDANLSRVLDLSILSNVTLTTSQSTTSQSDAAVINLTGNIGSTSVERTLTFPSGRAGVFVVDTTEVNFGTSRVVLKGDATDGGVALTSASDRTTFVYTNGTSVRRTNEKSAANVPLVGEVKMYAPPGGTIVSANLPSGWFVANGNNGTNDLRGKFIYGVSTVGQTGNTGGSLTDTINVANAGTVVSTALTSANLPPHSHGIFGADATIGGSLVTSRNQVLKSSGSGSATNTSQEYAMIVSPTINASDSDSAFHGTTQIVGGSGGSASHTHSFTPTSTNRTVDTVPPYFRLVYLQFTGN